MLGSKRSKHKSALEMSAVQNSLLIGSGGPVLEIADGESDAGSADSNRSLESLEESLFTKLSEFQQELRSEQEAVARVRTDLVDLSARQGSKLGQLQAGLREYAGQMRQRTSVICDTKFKEPADNITELMQMNLSCQGKMGTVEFSFPAKPFDDVQLLDLIQELRAELKGKIASSLQLVRDGGDIGPVQNFAPDPGSACRLTCSLRPRYRVSGA